MLLRDVADDSEASATWHIEEQNEDKFLFIFLFTFCSIFFVLGKQTQWKMSS